LLSNTNRTGHGPDPCDHRGNVTIHFLSVGYDLGHEKRDKG
jgi:hypothetical protein